MLQSYNKGLARRTETLQKDVNASTSPLPAPQDTLERTREGGMEREGDGEGCCWLSLFVALGEGQCSGSTELASDYLLHDHVGCVVRRVVMLQTRKVDPLELLIKVLWGAELMSTPCEGSNHAELSTLRCWMHRSYTGCTGPCARRGFPADRGGFVGMDQQVHED